MPFMQVGDGGLDRWNHSCTRSRSSKHVLRQDRHARPRVRSLFVLRRVRLPAVSLSSRHRLIFFFSRLPPVLSSPSFTVPQCHDLRPLRHLEGCHHRTGRRHVARGCSSNRKGAGQARRPLLCTGDCYCAGVPVRYHRTGYRSPTPRLDHPIVRPHFVVSFPSFPDPTSLLSPLSASRHLRSPGS